MKIETRLSGAGEASAPFAGLARVVRDAGLVLAVAAFVATPAAAQKITEVVADHVGSPDTYEYIEVAANPAAVHPTGNSGTVLVDLSAFTLVELDGTTDPGKILHVFPVGTTNGSGFWTTGYKTSTLEKPTFTILLVKDFTGAVGTDVDTNDDGALDTAPWSQLVDGVTFFDGSGTAPTYAAPVLGPGFDGLGTAPGGASRFPYYTDTDSVTDWKRNDFDGDGLPGFTGTLAAGEARNTPGAVTRVALADYYAGIDTSSAATLRSALHARIANHIRYPYSSGTTDTWDMLETADQDPVNSGQVLDIYKNEIYPKYGAGNSDYNREHSWPNSYGFNDATATSEYTDGHHLFISNITWNGNRGNQPFGTCNSGCTENATVANHGFGGGSGTYPGNSNWFNGSIYEVWGHMKGDLARAQLYMDVRYEGGTHPYTGTPETNLQLTDTLSQIQTNQPYMGLRSVLLAWHAADPPDDAERRRNDVVESFQGNRNPFVDHPEWVSCVFQGTGCSSVTGPPAVTTNAASVVTTVSATLNGSVNPNGLATTAAFEWGLTTAYGSTTATVTLGSGSTVQPLATGISGLAACTTYHFRATATSSGGTTNGGDLTFATSCPAPTVTTNPATSVTTSSATLNGTVNPNGVSTAASFEWGLTTAYGQATSVQAMGSGTSALPLSTTLSGLTACTTYHFRATATSTGGTATGVDRTFAASCPAPSATTTPASAITASGATLNGSVNPNGVETTGSFEWGTTTVYGQATATQPLGSGTAAQPLSTGISGLAPCTTYHFRARGSSAGGTAFGGDRSFTTLCPAPSASTTAATAVTISGATLNGAVNPNTLATTASFEWGPTASYGQTTAGQPMGSGEAAQPLSAVIAGLAPCATYHFRATATNAGGTGNGSDLTFTTSCGAPTVTTGAATDVTTTGATLNGAVNPNSLATTAWFEWGPTTSYGEMTVAQPVGSGAAEQPLVAAIAGLAPCRTYHYRATATSTGGTVIGSDVSFATTCTGRFFPLAPCRVLDTRDDSAMTDGVPRVVSFHGACVIPPTARALAANVTVTQPSLPGFVSVYPADGASTSASVVHFGAGRTRASCTIIKLSDDGTGRARLEATVPTGGTTHVIIDVSGYFD